MTERDATWDRAAEHRVRYAAVFDGEIRRHNERFRAAAAVGPAERVLDIGSGTGQSTRQAARAAASGRVLSVDISERLLAEGRRLAGEEGLDNVTFLRADAQAHPFEPAAFDVAISRFGTMFFADPVAAFTNIGRALRLGGRLALLVWQAEEHNEWMTFRTALARFRSPEPAPAGPDPFSLGDPATVERVLGAAGFGGVALEDVREPVWFGPDTETAFGFVSGLRATRELLDGLGPADAEAASAALRAALDAHRTGDGVLFDSRAWIVTAHR